MQRCIKLECFPSFDLFLPVFFKSRAQHIASEIALVDVVEDKLKGEVYDMQHGQAFTRGCTVKGDTG